ncbi:hypothetical protein C8A05DRAFT_17650 [Staphylotrichum tortipilum]|uniref:DUF7907 domain-containing protein n=1 Tax=Staphylotrichum tortipilum TaxID=2831512 RepID=A0AAN6MH20_9PEZI|nr:hypothetical protein C8A05DRAFT_17650 [Staphylotrichum longicolle]
MRLLPTLTLAATATALPSHPPSHSSSTGFQLLALPHPPTPGQPPSSPPRYLSAIHTGAGQNAAVLSPDLSSARLFYLNGTTPQIRARQATILTDGGTPPFPFSLQVQRPGEEGRVAAVSVGSGMPGAVERGRGVVNGWDRDGKGRGGWWVCEEMVAYYNRVFEVVRYAYDGKAPGEGCKAVRLVARCAVLNELPAGSLSSHEFVGEVGCEEGDK